MRPTNNFIGGGVGRTPSPCFHQYEKILPFIFVHGVTTTSLNLEMVQSLLMKILNPLQGEGNFIKRILMTGLPTEISTSDFMAIAGLIVVAAAAFWAVRRAIGLLGR